MFIRVLHLEMKGDSWDDALKRFREQVFPELERQEGFMRVILGGEPETGRAVLITMWQAARHAHAYEESGTAAKYIHSFDDMYAKEPQIEGYPVLFDREF